MKINISVDCTPVEARLFFGLPDVQPLQDHLLQEVEDRLKENLKIIDINHLLHTWLPGSIQGLENVQSNLWNQLISSLGSGSNSSKKREIDTDSV